MSKYKEYYIVGNNQINEKLIAHHSEPDDLIPYTRVIERAAYDRAIKTLKRISHSDNEVSRWATRCLRDLGEIDE